LIPVFLFIFSSLEQLDAQSLRLYIVIGLLVSGLLIISPILCVVISILRRQRRQHLNKTKIDYQLVANEEENEQHNKFVNNNECKQRNSINSVVRKTTKKMGNAEIEETTSFIEPPTQNPSAPLLPNNGKYCPVKSV